jgi:hypothetical protein
METISIDKKKDIAINPNPFDDYTIISIPGEINQPYTLEIIDINGVKVLSHSNIISNKFILGRKSMKPGTYFYKIFSSDYKEYYSGKLFIKNT